MIKIFGIIVAVFLIQTCKSFYFKSEKINDKDEIAVELMEIWLKKPLQDINYLNLMLRSDSYLKDFENSYISWLLNQVPITLNSYAVFENKSVPILTSDFDYGVIVTSMRSLSSTAQYFARPAGTYFFVLVDNIEFRELRDICHTLWNSWQIFQNYILSGDGVYIYDPFARDDVTGEYGQLSKYTGIYTMKYQLFNDMRGYPLRIQMFESVYSKPVLNALTKNVEYVYGLDGRVADGLQKRLNFSMHFMDPDPDYFGQRLENGSYNGALGSILNQDADVCFTGFFVKDYFTRGISFSVAMYEDQLCIYTRKAERVPEYILPILAVNYNVWIGFISIAFISSFVWALLRSFNLFLNIYDIDHQRYLHEPFKWQYIMILKDTWVVWVRVCLNFYPIFESEKVFVASLCLVSVIFGAIFECSLASSHINPLYLNDIDTLEELNATGQKILYRHASMRDDLFVAETSPLFASLNSKTVYMPYRNYSISEDIKKNGGKVGVNRYNSLMLESLEEIVTKKIWIVPEFPKHYSISYVWQKNAPWEETFNIILLKFLQAGLITKFERDMEIDAEVQIMREHLHESNGFRVLTIHDFQLAFYVLIIGNLLASICWVVEIIVSACRKR